MTDTVFYDEMVELAEELISYFGQPVTLVKKGDQAGYDSYGNATAGTADIEYTGIGCTLNYKNGEVDGSLIQNGDSKMLYQGDTPEIGYVVTLEGITWRIIEANPLNPAGILVMYTLQLRK